MFVIAGILMYGLFTGCSDNNEKLGSASINITDFTPVEGLPGTEVTISASGFGEQAKVFFNETEVTDYVSCSGNTIVVRVPDNASTGRISILDGDAFGFSTQEFTFIPSAIIQSYSQNTATAGETLIINGRNFFDINIEDIIVKFGNAVASVISATSTTITVVIPEGAESGPIIVQFRDIQTVTGPEFTVGQIVINVPDYLVNTKSYVLAGGTFKVDDNYIDGTRNGAYIIYEITPEADGLYNIMADISTNQGYNCYLNMDMGTDAEVLAQKAVDQLLTQQIVNLGGWSAFGAYTYGSFKLKGGSTYYLKISFLADGTSWVCNLTNLVLHYADDQSGEGIDVDNTVEVPYVLYANDFNSGTTLLPFLKRAEGTNYVKVVDQCAEFYYDPQMMIEHPGERAYKGAEVSCDEYATKSEGWYGYRIFLPEGKFPKEASGTIITQIFNNGYGNTWAGHLHINGETLAVGYRGSSAANAEIDVDVCKLEWGKWIKLVINFQAGTGNKGHIRIWVGEEIREDKPTLSLENINLGFGAWADSNTLADSYFSCKFGLYVADEYERTMRFDDLKALEGNPTGAFNIVKP
jgi:hypothetical protein